MTYKINTLDRKFKISKPTLRKYIRHLKIIYPNFSEHLSHGDKNIKLIDDRGLALLDKYIHSDSSTNAMNLAHQLNQQSQQKTTQDVAKSAVKQSMQTFSNQSNMNTNKILKAVNKANNSHQDLTNLAKALIVQLKLARNYKNILGNYRNLQVQYNNLKATDENNVKTARYYQSLSNRNYQSYLHAYDIALSNIQKHPIKLLIEPIFHR